MWQIGAPCDNMWQAIECYGKQCQSLGTDDNQCHPVPPAQYSATQCHQVPQRVTHSFHLMPHSVIHFNQCTSLPPSATQFHTVSPSIKTWKATHCNIRKGKQSQIVEHRGRMWKVVARNGTESEDNEVNDKKSWKLDEKGKSWVGTFIDSTACS